MDAGPVCRLPDDALIGDWNDLERHLQMGMKILSVEQGAGPEPVLTVEMPEAVRLELVGKARRRKPSLEEVMGGLARRAVCEPGKVKRVSLSGGLGIEMICGIDGMYRLQIWRTGAAPEAREWKRVLEAWPRDYTPPPRGLQKRAFGHLERRYLQAEWKIERKEKEDELKESDGAQL